MASKRARQVFVYEPFPSSFAILKANIRLNHAKNIRPFNLAVAGRSGKVKLFVQEKNLGGHSIYGNSDNFIRADSTTLKRIFNENKIGTINFLKIDCEGAEYDILLNTPDSYLKRIDRIAAEHHRVKGHDVQELRRLLEKNGFEVVIERFMLYAKRKAAFS